MLPLNSFGLLDNGNSTHCNSQVDLKGKSFLWYPSVRRLTLTANYFVTVTKIFCQYWAVVLMNLCRRLWSSPSLSHSLSLSALARNLNYSDPAPSSATAGLHSCEYKAQVKIIYRKTLHKLAKCQNMFWVTSKLSNKHSWCQLRSRQFPGNDNMKHVCTICTMYVL